MTIERVIDIVDELKPNTYPDDIKIIWLSNLDLRIWLELISTHGKQHTCKDEEQFVFKPVSNVKPLPVEAAPAPCERDCCDGEDEFRGYNADTPQDTELLVPEPYAYDIYVNYLTACIDRENGETEKYNNAIVLYNAGYTNYAMAYTRAHMPKSGGRFRF